MLLESSALWFAATNTWVMAADKGGVAIVIDAPPDPEAVIELLARHSLTLGGLLVTHGHVDHVGGAGAIERATGSITYIHPDDDYLSLDPTAQVQALFGMVVPGSYLPAVKRRPLHDGDHLEIGGMQVEVRHTPGHTPGHCCFYLASEGWLFSGDQLFAGSIGRTDLPGGDFDALMRSMDERVLDLADDTRVLPGHGPETTVGRERRTNPFLRGR
jgi:glyoxylase-like metal-dependent hydrolase (beta-lactamase superfamily II)